MNVVVFKGHSLFEFLLTGAQGDTTCAFTVLISLGCLAVVKDEVILN
jgi:hypothetical protein